MCFGGDTVGHFRWSGGVLMWRMVVNRYTLTGKSRADQPAQTASRHPEKTLKVHEQGEVK
jgi:hypothetical protein